MFLACFDLGLCRCVLFKVHKVYAGHGEFRGHQGPPTFGLFEATFCFGFASKGHFVRSPKKRTHWFAISTHCSNCRIATFQGVMYPVPIPLSPICPTLFLLPQFAVSWVELSWVPGFNGLAKRLGSSCYFSPPPRCRSRLWSGRCAGRRLHLHDWAGIWPRSSRRRLSHGTRLPSGVVTIFRALGFPSST